MPYDCSQSGECGLYLYCYRFFSFGASRTSKVSVYIAAIAWLWIWSQRNVTRIFSIHIYLLPSLKLKFGVNVYMVLMDLHLNRADLQGHPIVIIASHLILFDLLRHIQIRIAFFSRNHILFSVFSDFCFAGAAALDAWLGANIFIITKRHSIAGSATREYNVRCRPLFRCDFYSAINGTSLPSLLHCSSCVCIYCVYRECKAVLLLTGNGVDGIYVITFRRS